MQQTNSGKTLKLAHVNKGKKGELAKLALENTDPPGKIRPNIDILAVPKCVSTYVCESA